MELVDNRNSKILASISQVNSGLIRRDLRKVSSARETFSQVKAQDLLQQFTKAGELFITANLKVDSDDFAQSPEEYINALSGSTGLPQTLCRSNMKKIHYVLTHMEMILHGLSRGLTPDILDSSLGNYGGIEMCFYPVTDCLGVVLPSNSPGVNSLWLPAIAMKIPVIIKPGREDPWTPLRIIQALYSAGIPREAISFYPTDHEGADTILEQCGRGMIFGGANVNRYESDSRIQIHGAGRSKVLIGNDCVDQWESFLDVILESITTNSGRSCINASTIVTPRHGDAIAEELARCVAGIQPKALDDGDAQLAGFANSKMAEVIDKTIESGLKATGAEDITGRLRRDPRKIEFGGQIYLLPTIVKCESFEHPLANSEFMFPFASVVQIPQKHMESEIGHSLVVTAITKDQNWIKDLIKSPHIDRLNIGTVPTTLVHWDQPHEGNLFDFLYHRRAIQRVQA